MACVDPVAVTPHFFEHVVRGQHAVVQRRFAVGVKIFAPYSWSQFSVNGPNGTTVCASSANATSATLSYGSKRLKNNSNPARIGSIL